MGASVRSASSSPNRPLSPVSKSVKSVKPVKSDKSDKSCKPDKSDKTEKPGKAGKFGKIGKADRKFTGKDKKGKEGKACTTKVAKPKSSCDVRKRTREEMRNIMKHYTRLAIKITKEAIKLAEHLQNWVDKNARPKKIDITKLLCRRDPSRWAKRGPMTRRDWVRFYTWAEKNAVAKQLNLPKPEPPKKKKLKPGEEPRTLQDAIAYMDKLANPKKPREKYKYPPPPDYPYAPQIDFKEPAKKDKGRPFPKPRVPKCFQHIYVELDFWKKLRFPVRSAALSYVPSENIERLALPRVVPPPKPHCTIPEKPKEYVEPRKKMTRRQWKDHLRRLRYLAAPVLRSSYLVEEDDIDFDEDFPNYFIW